MRQARRNHRKKANGYKKTFGDGKCARHCSWPHFGWWTRARRDAAWRRYMIYALKTGETRHTQKKKKSPRGTFQPNISTRIEDCVHDGYDASLALKFGTRLETNCLLQYSEGRTLADEVPYVGGGFSGEMRFHTAESELFKSCFTCLAVLSFAAVWISNFGENWGCDSTPLLPMTSRVSILRPVATGAYCSYRSDVPDFRASI